ncbi:hypothetical protein [Chitinophaga sp. RCC_12]|uniref:hypothetical protein n=1 Tax=Chitinophaga sp. RCC_12 TaxID=3239226 RepID=UPI0035247551
MMKRLILSLQQRPYLLFLLTAIVLIIYSFFIRHQMTDIHVHDTMLIISTYLIYWLISFCFIVAAGLYAGLTRFLPNRALTWTHILLTLLLLLSVAIIINHYDNLYKNAGQNDSNASIGQTIHYIQTAELIYRWLILLFLATQLIFVGHFVWGITRHLQKKQ